MMTFDGATFGIPQPLFDHFKAAIIGDTLNDYDIAEILYILKSQEVDKNLSALNQDMGGQHEIKEIVQSNGVRIPSLLGKHSSPEEAYNRFAMADVRQANINEFLNRFYNVIFTDE